jgi:glycerol-3-phosphate dehydrogenase
MEQSTFQVKEMAPVNYNNMDRNDVLKKIEERSSFDIIIIGGGATGIGSALEASLRGYKTLLVEKADFTKGTSSRSTKLIHGGVRYLAQGDIFLVFEALRERGYLKKNAPHLVHDQKFIIPNYRWWEGPFYTIGLTIYDLMSGLLSLGSSYHLSRKRVRTRMPGIRHKGLNGGVLYHDGQFDDSRLAMDLLHAVFENKGLAINYFQAIAILKDLSGKVNGIIARDEISGNEYNLHASAVINATGVWVDDVIKMDHPEAQQLVRPSQGVHLVVDKKFLPGGYALMIPKTDDGRVLFAVPWHEHIILGTTDTPLNHALEEPRAQEEEIEFILGTAARYLSLPPDRNDILSVFAGLRPLAAPKDNASKTKEISRSHKILISQSKLITITGGKWTTYRKMAEDAINKAVLVAGLPKVPSKSKNFRISGDAGNMVFSNPFVIYGSRGKNIHELVGQDPLLGAKLHPDLSYIKAEVIWLCRTEMVVKLEDLLARRLRVLFLNAHAAIEIAPAVAEMVAVELKWSQQKIKDELKSFLEVAKNYIID